MLQVFHQRGAIRVQGVQAMDLELLAEPDTAGRRTLRCMDQGAAVDSGADPWCQKIGSADGTGVASCSIPQCAKALWPGAVFQPCFGGVRTERSMVKSVIEMLPRESWAMTSIVIDGGMIAGPFGSCGSPGIPASGSRLPVAILLSSGNRPANWPFWVSKCSQAGNG